MTVSILIVDDEADVAELFRQHFRREVRKGLYVLHFACSVEEALQMLADGIRPQLIVIRRTSICPAWTVSACCARSRPEMPVMMVTAYGDDERRRRASEYGAAEFLAKPVDFAYLKARLWQLPTAAD